jgi:hypothetical protein
MGSLAEIHEGLPPWVGDFARYATLQGRQRNRISLYGARRWLSESAHIPRMYSGDMRLVLQDQLRVKFQGCHDHKVIIPETMQRFWRLVLLPGLGADDSSLASYAIHIAGFTRAKLKDTLRILHTAMDPASRDDGVEGVPSLEEGTQGHCRCPGDASHVALQQAVLSGLFANSTAFMRLLAETSLKL